MEPDDETKLKMEINNFLWMHAPSLVSLSRAEDMACTILKMLLDADSPSSETGPRKFRVRNSRVTEDVTLRGWCYSFVDHFDIHWDDGSHNMDVPELSVFSIFKDGA